MDGVATAAEVDGDRPPGRPGRLDHHFQAGLRGGAAEGRPLHLLQAVAGRPAAPSADLATVTAEDAHGVRSADTKVDANQAAVVSPIGFLPYVIWASVPGGQRSGRVGW